MSSSSLQQGHFLYNVLLKKTDCFETVMTLWAYCIHDTTRQKTHLYRTVREQRRIPSSSDALRSYPLRAWIDRTSSTCPRWIWPSSGGGNGQAGGRASERAGGRGSRGDIKHWFTKKNKKTYTRIHDIFHFHPGQIRIITHILHEKLKVFAWVSSRTSSCVLYALDDPRLLIVFLYRMDRGW